MERREKIYISGPITGTDDYKERFEEAEKEMMAAGYIVINPEKVNEQLPPPPHTSYEQYMKMSLVMLNDIERRTRWKSTHRSHWMSGHNGRRTSGENWRRQRTTSST